MGQPNRTKMVFGFQGRVLGYQAINQWVAVEPVDGYGMPIDPGAVELVNIDPGLGNGALAELFGDTHLGIEPCPVGSVISFLECTDRMAWGHRGGQMKLGWIDAKAFEIIDREPSVELDDLVVPADYFRNHHLLEEFAKIEWERPTLSSHARVTL